MNYSNQFISLYIKDSISHIVNIINELKEGTWILNGFDCILRDILNVRYELKQDYGVRSIGCFPVTEKYGYLMTDEFIITIENLANMIDKNDDFRLLSLIRYRLQSDGKKGFIWKNSVETILKKNNMQYDRGVLSMLGDRLFNQNNERSKLVNDISVAFDTLMDIYSSWERLPISAVVMLKSVIEFSIRQVNMREKYNLDYLDEKTEILSDYHMEDLYLYVTKKMISSFKADTNLGFFKKKLLIKWIEKYGIDPSLSLNGDIYQVGYFYLRSHCKGIKQYLKSKRYRSEVEPV